MPVGRIERIVNGIIIGEVKRGRDGKYRWLPYGSNIKPKLLDTLDEVADHLRANPGSGVRMKPGSGKIVDNIYIYRWCEAMRNSILTTLFLFSLPKIALTDRIICTLSDADNPASTQRQAIDYNGRTVTRMEISGRHEEYQILRNDQRGVLAVTYTHIGLFVDVSILNKFTMDIALVTAEPGTTSLPGSHLVGSCVPLRQ